MPGVIKGNKIDIQDGNWAAEMPQLKCRYCHLDQAARSNYKLPTKKSTSTTKA